MSEVELSAKVPMAVYCNVSVSTMVQLSGSISIDKSAGPTTVMLVVSEASPSAAVIVVVPSDIPSASPSEPAELLIVATPVLLEDHVTKSVTSPFVESVYVAVAVY